MIGAEIPALSRLRRSVHTPVTTYAPGGGRILRCSAAPYIPPSPQQNSAVMSRSGPAPRDRRRQAHAQRCAGKAVRKAPPSGGPPRPHHAPLGGALDRKEHTSELQSIMRISYAVFCLKK